MGLMGKHQGAGRAAFPLEALRGESLLAFSSIPFLPSKPTTVGQALILLYHSDLLCLPLLLLKNFCDYIEPIWTIQAILPFLRSVD